MMAIKNPVPLAGGNRAGTLQASYAVDIREHLRNQAALRLRRQRHVEHVHLQDTSATPEQARERLRRTILEQQTKPSTENALRIRRWSDALVAALNDGDAP